MSNPLRCDRAVGLTHVARACLPQPGADIQFNRPNRLDVCIVQNHLIALYVRPHTDPHTIISNDKQSNTNANKNRYMPKKKPFK